MQFGSDKEMREIAARAYRRRAMVRLPKPRTVEREMPGFWSYAARATEPWQRQMLAVMRSLYQCRVDEGGWPTRDGAAPGEDE